MSNVEQRLREGLASAGIDGTSPADPVAWVRARVARDRRRRAVGGVVTVVAMTGTVAVAVPSLWDGDADRLTGQVAGQPPAAPSAPADDGPALVVHNTAGQDSAVANAGIQACLQGPGVSSRTVDDAEPTSYIVTVGGDDEELASAETCLAAVAGVIVERSTEALAGRGPVPVATLPGGVPVYSDVSQDALAAQLRDRLRRLVESALPGVAEDGPVGSATTRTSMGPSRNLQGVVDWHDERGHISFIAARVERFTGTGLDPCTAEPSPPELGCKQVRPGKGLTVTVFTPNVTQGGRRAVHLLDDGSAVALLQLPRNSAPPEPGSREIRRVTPRPDLPLSDRELAAMAASLAR